MTKTNSMKPDENNEGDKYDEDISGSSSGCNQIRGCSKVLFVDEDERRDLVDDVDDDEVQ